MNSKMKSTAFKHLLVFMVILFLVAIYGLKPSEKEKNINKVEKSTKNDVKYFSSESDDRIANDLVSSEIEFSWLESNFIV